MKIYLFTSTLITMALVLYSSAAQGKSHTTKPLCSANEQVIFSCELTNKKIVSLCASNDLSKDKGYLYYIYGKPNKIEMKYPQSKQHPGELFRYGFASHNPQQDGVYLSFSKNKIIYAIYSEFDYVGIKAKQIPYRRGVLTYKSGNENASSNAVCKYIHQDKVDKLYNLDLEEDYNLFDHSGPQVMARLLPELKTEINKQIEDNTNKERKRKLYPPKTLCTKKEKVFFSCELNNKKTISICGSLNLSKDKGYLHYLYGKSNKIELTYPSDINARPQKLFNYSMNFYPNTSNITYFDFINNKMKYTIYIFNGKWSEYSGLAIQNQCSAILTNDVDSNISETIVSNKTKCGRSFLSTHLCKNETIVFPNELSFKELGF